MLILVATCMCKELCCSHVLKSGSACARFDHSIEALAWLPASKPAGTLLLVSGGGDGSLQVWRVGLTGELACTLEGALGPMESVRSLCCSAEHGLLAMSDTSGHIKLWDVSAVDCTCTETLLASIKLVRGHAELSTQSM